MKPDFSAIRSHIFRDRKFKIKWRAPKRDKNCPKGHVYFGNYDPNKMELMIYPSEDPLELLDTVLDETAHANWPDIDNESIREGVLDTMKLLKRMGIKVSFGG